FVTDTDKKTECDQKHRPTEYPGRYAKYGSFYQCSNSYQQNENTCPDTASSMHFPVIFIVPSVLHPFSSCLPSFFPPPAFFFPTVFEITHTFYILLKSKAPMDNGQ